MFATGTIIIDGKRFNGWRDSRGNLHITSEHLPVIGSFRRSIIFQSWRADLHRQGVSVRFRPKALWRKDLRA